VPVSLNQKWALVATAQESVDARQRAAAAERVANNCWPLSRCADASVVVAAANPWYNQT
jgi:hypothetical protein